MAFKKNENATGDNTVSYKICGLDRVVDEKGSAFVAVRKIAWGYTEDEEPEEKKIHFDIRKYYTTPEGEKVSKGVSFLTEEGPHELIRVLLEEGYGHTKECLEQLVKREDFKDSVKAIHLGKDSKSSDDEFYDPRELLKLA